MPLPDIPELEEHTEICRASASGHRSFADTDLQRTAHPPPDVRHSSVGDHLLIDHDAR